MTSTQLTHRTVSRVLPSQRTLEGGGVEIRRAFPTAQIEDVDPFLLLDHMGPIQIAPGQVTGFPEHPHRGFETVTYLLEGQIEHKDSFGNRGFLEAGDVQWMTAGSGLVHSEMPGRDLVRDGGRLQGFQIWVNLPKRNKMAPPHYQELKASGIPHAESANGGVNVRVIAGESHGTRGAIETRTPILYLHLTLAPGATHVQQVSKGFNALAYVVKGKALFEGFSEIQSEGRLILFSNDGDGIGISNPSGEPVDVLLLAGEPIGEPVARYGPFVMNTREELYQAFDDFRKGKLGQIAGA
jgi:redox-sensitive bicupin YhaK (pirin superfamily)